MCRFGDEDVEKIHSKELDKSDQRTVLNLVQMIDVNPVLQSFPCTGLVSAHQAIGSWCVLRFQE